jgi:hypothetical protein
MRDQIVGSGGPTGGDIGGHDTGTQPHLVTQASFTMSSQPRPLSSAAAETGVSLGVVPTLRHVPSWPSHKLAACPEMPDKPELDGLLFKAELALRAARAVASVSNEPEQHSNYNYAAAEQSKNPAVIPSQVAAAATPSEPEYNLWTDGQKNRQTSLPVPWKWREPRLHQKICPGEHTGKDWARAEGDVQGVESVTSATAR